MQYHYNVHHAYLHLRECCKAIERTPKCQCWIVGTNALSGLNKVVSEDSGMTPGSGGLRLRSYVTSRS